MQEEFFRDLVDRAGALICVKDADGFYRYANDRFLCELGIADRFEPGLADQDLLAPDVAARLRNHDREALLHAGTCLHHEKFQIAGHNRAFLFNRFPLAGEDGRVGVAAVALEIADNAHMDSDPLACRALFKGILDTAADAVVSVDDEQRIVLFNNAAERVFGYSAEEILNQPLDLLLPPDERASHRRHVAGYTRSGAKPRLMGDRRKVHGRRKDGSIFPAEVSISGIRLDGRSIATAILRDVTEARSLEEAELMKRAILLEKANRELEAFAYSVSHDLRAPLRSISGFSQVLIEDFYDALPEAARDSLDRIQAASQRMGQLIDDMLELSRFSRTVLARQEVDLSAMARDIASELWATQPERTVAFDIAAGVSAEADAHLVHAVLRNLLGNAWKFTARKEAAHIEFGRFTDRKGQTVFFVRDDGAGFDMAYADKLFGVFQRLHPANEFPGTGVGLAIVQRVVHKHGGDVWAEGCVGRGATFYFTLG